jgi:hypothetical protein
MVRVNRATIFWIDGTKYTTVRDRTGWVPARWCRCALGPHWHDLDRAQRSKRAAERICERAEDEGGRI